MRVLDLMLKDLYQIVKDWKTFVFLLAMPMAFTLLLGFAFSEEGEDPRLPVTLLNQDQGGVLTPPLVALIDRSDAIRPVVEEGATPESLAEDVQDEKVAAAVIIPDGYSARVLDGEIPPLRVIVDSASNAGQTAQTNIQGAVNRLLTSVQAAQAAVGALAEADPDRYAVPSARKAALAAVLDDAVDAWVDPSFAVTSRHTGQEADDKAPNAFAHSSAGTMVQFAIAGLIGAAELVVTERKSRTLQRMLTTSMRKVAVLAGHFLAMMMMVLAQLVVLVVFGQVAFGVPYAHAPLAIAVLVVAFAFFTGAMGLLIGGLAKSEEQVVIFSLLPMFVLSGLGGAWVPLEFTSETVQIIGRFTPTAWAIEGLENVTMRGMDLSSVVVPTLVVLGFGVLCLIVAVWQFRVE